MVGVKGIVSMGLLQSEKKQVNNGWSKSNVKYEFTPIKEKTVNNDWRYMNVKSKLLQLLCNEA